MPEMPSGREDLPEAPPVDAQARARALAAALARFDAVQAQGSAEPARPRGRRNRSWTSAMTRHRAAVAAAALLVLAGPLAWKLAGERAAEPVPAQRPSEPAPPASSGAAVEAARREAQDAAALPAPARPEPMALLPPPAPAPATRSLGRTAAPAAPGLTIRAPAFEAPPEPESSGRDRFEAKPQAGFTVAREAPVSTFSIDVDTAAYGVVRASLARNLLPPAAAVRPEELINYFPYDYAPAESPEAPFRVSATLLPSPWAEGRKLLRIGVKGYALAPRERPRANLVFLIDTSGSMAAENRLPLVKQALALLVDGLTAQDRVAIVAYAGQAGTVLEPTPASERARILAAIDGLSAGGATAGGEGLRQAYALAARSYDAAAVNRVMIATDGDFNVGIGDRATLQGFVEREREKGIFLSVLGFGMGNLNDALMQALAQNGNGTAAHIDTLNEARKVLVEEASATLFPIAKDVKIQVEFNPAKVAEYRLIGYESRALARSDFDNDRVDAGEVGSGQTATALYEIVPAGGPRNTAPLRYGPAEPTPGAETDETAFVRLRYTLPKEEASRLVAVPVGPGAERDRFEEADADARFAAAVAGFAEILRGGRWTGRFSLDDVLRLAAAARGEDPFGYRAEFLQLVRTAKSAQALAAARR